VPDVADPAQPAGDTQPQLLVALWLQDRSQVLLTLCFLLPVNSFPPCVAQAAAVDYKRTSCCGAGNHDIMELETVTSSLIKFCAPAPHSAHLPNIKLNVLSKKRSSTSKNTHEFLEKKNSENFFAQLVERGP